MAVDNSIDEMEGFFIQVREILESKAKDKGYLSPVGNVLMDFMNYEFPDHALGEIIYKVVRYNSKKDPVDLIKIAAWACLVYNWRNK